MNMVDGNPVFDFTSFLLFIIGVLIFIKVLSLVIVWTVRSFMGIPQAEKEGVISPSSWVRNDL